MMHYLYLGILAIAIMWGGSAAPHAQSFVADAGRLSGKEAREESLRASQLELVIGKLQEQQERLLGDIRALQRANAGLAKGLEDANARSQAQADEMQRLQNTQLSNIQTVQKQLAARLDIMGDKATLWGDGQRDCKELGAKHQQLKVTVKPDGSRGVRYLCFDGKALHLGSEVYTVGE